MCVGVWGVGVWVCVGGWVRGWGVCVGGGVGVCVYARACLFCKLKTFYNT